MHKLLRNGDFFLVIAVRIANIHFRTETCGEGRNLCGLLAQVDRQSCSLVDGENRAYAGDLKLKLLTVNHFGRRNQCFKNNGGLGACIDHERFEFANNLYSDSVTIVKIDLLLRICYFDCDNTIRRNFLFGRFTSMILNDPFVPALLVLENRDSAERRFLFRDDFL